MDDINYDFYLYTISIGFISLLCGYVSYRKTNDPFHPAIFFGAQLFFLYCYLPYVTVVDFGVSGYLTREQCSQIQLINLAGVFSLCAGLLGNTNRHQQSLSFFIGEDTSAQKRILKVAKLFGLVGTLSFFYILISSGGLFRVYGHAYGGGWNASGYVRELFLLTVPALLWYFIATGHCKLRKNDLFWIILFSSPLLIHGLLGARRGPTLVIAFTLVMGYFFSTGRRPPFLLVLKGGLVLGLFVLLLVSNRSQVFIGSSVGSVNDPLSTFSTQESNEFIYGAGTIINAEYFENYNYGLRYLTVMLIRPIPRAIWPSKYLDASQWFGIPNLEENAGTGAAEFSNSVGWTGAVGAAPGIVADSWLEFWWGCCLFLFLIGRLYSGAWSRAKRFGGIWIVVFIVMAALSGYLVTQTFEAMIFRLLFMAIPSWVIWVFVKRKISAKAILNMNKEIIINE